MAEYSVVEEYARLLTERDELRAEVERLRPAAEMFDEAMTAGLNTAITEMARWDAEALQAENERLRAENSHLNDEIVRLTAQAHMAIREQAAEVERLRTALHAAEIELEKWRGLFRDPKGSTDSTPVFTREDVR